MCAWLCNGRRWRLKMATVLIAILFLFFIVLFKDEQSLSMNQVDKESVKYVPNNYAISGKLFSGKSVRDIPLQFSTNTFFTPKRINSFKIEKKCKIWAVSTTISLPSKPMKKLLKLNGLCLVVVADRKTPDEKTFLGNLTNEERKNCKFLGLKEQEDLYPYLASTITLDTFGRKNIGFMYAIHHEPELIWDFDDDNDGIVEISDFKDSRKFTTPCKDKFKSNVLNPYPYFGGGASWPRGQPLQSIIDENTMPKTFCEVENVKKIGVIQSLANKQPDVDAIFRLTQKTPFNFSASPKTHKHLVIPKNVYVPFNAQATMWLPSAFEYLALPISVTGRVSDIWRGYFAVNVMHRKDIKMVFSAPYIIQDRNPHNYLRDFEGEMDLYLKSKQLTDLLTSTSYQSLVELYKDMYRRKYIHDKDLFFIDAWCKTYQDIINSKN